MIQFDYDLSTRLKPPTSLHPSFTKTIHLGSAKIHHFRFRRSDRGYQRGGNSLGWPYRVTRCHLAWMIFLRIWDPMGWKSPFCTTILGYRVVISKVFLMFIIAWGNDPIWRSYFCRWVGSTTIWGNMFGTVSLLHRRVASHPSIGINHQAGRLRWVGNFRIFQTPSESLAGILGAI